MSSSLADMAQRRGSSATTPSPGISSCGSVDASFVGAERIAQFLARVVIVCLSTKSSSLPHLSDYITVSPAPAPALAPNPSPNSYFPHTYTVPDGTPFRSRTTLEC